MVDRNSFMETLHSVQEIARASAIPMDRETALSYFKDMELSAEQEELVYQFLLLPSEEANGESGEEADSEADDTIDAEPTESLDTEGDNEKGQQDNCVDASEQTHFRMYLDEVEEIIELDDELEGRMYQQLFAGHTSVINALSTQWLKPVLAIAEEYKDRGYLLDDLVQEGNMGLLMELHELAMLQEDVSKTEAGLGTFANLAEVRRYLQQAVRSAIEEYLGEESGETQQSDSIVAKVSLVHEAKKLLTEEMGETPSLRTLAEYTRIPEEEVSDILSLIKKK